MAEAKEYVPKAEEKRPIDDYFKAFSNLDKNKANKLSEEIRAINSPKIKEEDIAKVADFLPQDSEDVNKIFVETSLSEDEINKILEIVKKY